MANEVKKNMIDGTKITLGKHEYIIPPAPFACVEKYEDVFMGRDTSPKPSVMFDILHMSLQRNYPDLNRDQLLMDVDIANMGNAFESVMFVNAEDSGTEGGVEKK